MPEFVEALIVIDLNCNYSIIDHNIKFFDIFSANIKQLGFVLDLNDRSKIIFCGDKPCHTNNYHYLHKCKWLIHETFCLSYEEHIFNQYPKHHSVLSFNSLIIINSSHYCPAKRFNILILLNANFLYLLSFCMQVTCWNYMLLIGWFLILSRTGV